MTCPKDRIIYDPERGEYICMDTGEVLEDHVIDQGPEWRVFSPEDKVSRSRIGAPLTSIVHDKGLTTYIGRVSRRLSDYQRRKALKLQEINRRLRVSPKDRRLVNMLSELNNATGRLGLPARVRETAAAILRKLYEKHTIRRPQLPSYLAAAIYIACKINNVTSKTKEEIMSILDVSSKEFWNAYRRIRDEVLKRPLRPSKPIDYVARITSKLGLPDHITTLAYKLSVLMTRHGLTDGKGPIGVAAATVYVAAVVLDEKKTQREVADAAGVTEVTVRNRYKDIVDNFLIEVAI